MFFRRSLHRNTELQGEEIYELSSPPSRSLTTSVVADEVRACHINKVEATELKAGGTSGNSRICEVEAGESGSQGLSQLSNGFDANLGHIRSHINNTIKNRNYGTY